MVSRRVKAEFIDFFILLFIGIIMGIVLMVALSGELTDWYDVISVEGITEEQTSVATEDLLESIEPKLNIYVIAYSVATILIFGIVPILNNGSSFGKKAMKIKVANVDSTPTLWFNHLIRSHFVILSLISIITVFISISLIQSILGGVSWIVYILLVVNFILLLSSSDGRRLQDKLLNLDVVYIDPDDNDIDNNSNKSSNNKNDDPLSNFE